MDKVCEDNDYYVFEKKEFNNIISDSSYCLEIIPEDENYIVDVYLDFERNIIGYYYLLTKNNRLDNPYYDSYYLGIIYIDGKIRILDEDKLIDAYNNSKVNQKEFESLYKLKKNLLIELENKTNKYMNIDYNKYLDSML